MDNFPAENQKLPGKGRSCTSVWTTSRLKIRHHRKRAAWYTHFWKTWFGRLSICHFTSIFERVFFIIIEKQQFWTMAVNIWLHDLLFFIYIILEDWIYFRDNKIVRWFHKKNLHQILQTFRYFPNVFDGKSQYLLQSRLLSIKLINFFLLQYNSLHRMLLFLSVRYKS